MENTLKFCSVESASSYQHTEPGSEHAFLYLVLVNGEGILKELVAGINLGWSRELTQLKLKDKHKFILELKLLIA